MDIEIPPVSIFQLPETITTDKPEAYKPQQIGFGPYHHFRPENTRGLKAKMKHKKLLVVQKFLGKNSLFHLDIDFKTFVDKVLPIVPGIRECYEMALQDDDVSLAMDFAIDGIFLLDLFLLYDQIDGRYRSLAQDISMLENQIPLMVLKEIDMALKSPSGTTENLHTIYRSFCKTHSPLVLCSRSQGPTHVEHLLHYMYHSILNNVPKEALPHSTGYKTKIAGSAFELDVEDAFDPIIKCTEFVEKLPKEEIVQIYKKIIKSLQKFSRSSIAIASASKLQGIAGFRFHHLDKHKGIEKIKFDPKKNIYLPFITLNDDSEVILRNLVAYETLMSDSDQFPLTDYMGLMCWLVVDAYDVKILKEVGIIKSDLGDDEVAKIFVGMSSHILSLNTKQKSRWQGNIDEVKKVYESKPRIRALLFSKKLANWLLVGLTAIGSFVGATWKIVAFIISIVTMSMLTYKAYCDVHGCNK